VAIIALYFMAILLAALLLEPLARRLHLPFGNDTAGVGVGTTRLGCQ